ncbi:MAG: diguanylate cyclase, partial [Candidatus Bipolaricaulis sp.]|nr:diguanylate cyclase [Candidatus Bipolaricaulis sp.]
MDEAVSVTREGVPSENQRLLEFFRHAANGMYQGSKDGRFVLANDAMARMLGYRDGGELQQIRIVDAFALESDSGSVLSRLHEGTSVENAELTLRAKDGPSVEALLNARVVRDEGGEILYHEGILTDITRLRKQEAQLLHLAAHDPLTGLCNRREFGRVLEQHLAEARRYGNHGAVLWMDLDGFKEINDGLGHKVGDDLLASLAHRMRTTVRDSDVLARLGGDEFAVLYLNVDSDQAQIAAARLLEAIRRHTAVIQGETLRTTASLGIVLFPDHGTGSSELLMKADMAMYRAKAEGRNRFCLYSPDEERVDAPESRVDWLRVLRDALENDGFILYAQPILDLAENRIVRYEILLRLRGHDGQIIPPGAFLDVAEQFGLSSDIDRWVLQHVMDTLSDESLPRDVSFAVNLSPRSLTDRALLSAISGRTAVSVIGPVRLVLEITETAAIYNIHVAKDFLRALRTQGYEFALDDFGMGFSS